MSSASIPIKSPFYKSLLTRVFGFPATLIHGDTTVLDRWFWLKKKLPLSRQRDRLLDVGCGSGAFTTGASLRGYDSLGLSWDERNSAVASERAEICKAENIQFDVLDVRQLHSRKDLQSEFDVAICFENIEHIIDDKKLMVDMAACLKPGGRLLLTAPFYYYEPLTSGDSGPFSSVEDGGHVRRGYTKAMLTELCEQAGLRVEEFEFCSGYLSQKITRWQRLFSIIHPAIGWLLILPLRGLPPLFDRRLTKFLDWPYYSICMEAYKPRFDDGKKSKI